MEIDEFSFSLDEQMSTVVTRCPTHNFYAGVLFRSRDNRSNIDGQFPTFTKIYNAMKTKNIVFKEKYASKRHCSYTKINQRICIYIIYSLSEIFKKKALYSFNCIFSLFDAKIKNCWFIQDFHFIVLDLALNSEVIFTCILTTSFCFGLCKLK